MALVTFIRFALAVLLAAATSAQPMSVEFAFTAAAQAWTVPDNVHYIQVDAWGAFASYFPVRLPSGGFVSAILRVEPGQILYVFVGGGDGWNGGVAGGAGASDIRTNASDLNSRLLVAGGSGAGGQSPSSSGIWLYCTGGAGGGEVGASSDSDTETVGGAGGSQVAGGSGGSMPYFSGTLHGSPGSFGYGGSTCLGGGGGGGGYFGGGGGCGCGGGGGSNFITPAAHSLLANVQGGHAGDGWSMDAAHGRIVVTVMPDLPAPQEPPSSQSPAPQQPLLPSQSPPLLPSLAMGDIEMIFSFTGTSESFVVPPGVNRLAVFAWGASGGVSNYISFCCGPWRSGSGGFVHATVPVLPGETLLITVGGSNGFNGGGTPINSADSYYSFAAYGGGATSIRSTNSRSTDASSWLVGAGGGGGGSFHGSFDRYSNFMSRGGAGGGFEGAAGGHGARGGKSPFRMFSGGNAVLGSLPSGGGGGGCYGGSAGVNGGGGGGGSSCVGNGAILVSSLQGVQAGHGQLILRFPLPSPSNSPTPSLSTGASPSVSSSSTSSPSASSSSSYTASPTRTQPQSMVFEPITARSSDSGILAELARPRNLLWDSWHRVHWYLCDVGICKLDMATKREMPAVDMSSVGWRPLFLFLVSMPAVESFVCSVATSISSDRQTALLCNPPGSSFLTRVLNSDIAMVTPLLYPAVMSNGWAVLSCRENADTSRACVVDMAQYAHAGFPDSAFQPTQAWPTESSPVFYSFSRAVGTPDGGVVFVRAADSCVYSVSVASASPSHLRRWEAAAGMAAGSVVFDSTYDRVFFDCYENGAQPNPTGPVDGELVSLCSLQLSGDGVVSVAATFPFAFTRVRFLQVIATGGVANAICATSSTFLAGGSLSETSTIACVDVLSPSVLAPLSAPVAARIISDATLDPGIAPLAGSLLLPVGSRVYYLCRVASRLDAPSSLCHFELSSGISAAVAQLLPGVHRADQLAGSLYGATTILAGDDMLLYSLPHNGP